MLPSPIPAREVASVERVVKAWLHSGRATNWANPGATLSSSTTFDLLTNTCNGSNAPGIGSGEPFNVQRRK